ncbi:porin [Rugamonas sp. A1-17]|nr:porin [Rugamonas sp. A1-17]
MKPIYIMLAGLAPLVAAAQAPSQAPSPVQVYGLLDAGVVAERGCNGPCAHTRLDSGVSAGSRLGVRGREDLGGGTSAVYTLETGILNDTGASDQNGKLFGRQAYVGLDGPLGAVTLGRQYNLLYETLTDVADPFHGGMAGSAANLVGYTTRRYDNTIKYQSPRSKSGWNGAAIYSVGESPYNSKANRAYGATIGYADGAVNLRVTHQRKDNALDASGAASAVDQSASNTLVAANVDFGRFVGYAAYGRSRGVGSSPWDMSNPYGAVAQSTPSDNSRDVLVGVAVPMGATTFLASYIHKDDRSGAHRDANQLAVGVSYALSRRTELYGAFARIQNRNGAGYTVGNATGAGHGDRAINIGLRHAF